MMVGGGSWRCCSGGGSCGRGDDSGSVGMMVGVVEKEQE